MKLEQADLAVLTVLTREAKGEGSNPAWWAVPLRLMEEAVVHALDGNWSTALHKAAVAKAKEKSRGIEGVFCRFAESLREIASRPEPVRKAIPVVPYLVKKESSSTPKKKARQSRAKGTEKSSPLKRGPVKRTVLLTMEQRVHLRQLTDKMGYTALSQTLEFNVSRLYAAMRGAVGLLPEAIDRVMSLKLEGVPTPPVNRTRHKPAFRVPVFAAETNSTPDLEGVIRRIVREELARCFAQLSPIAK